MDPHVTSRLKVCAVAALFSTAGAAIKSCGLTGWQVAGFRSAVAAVAVLLMTPLARRRWDGPTVIVGLAYATTLILFVQANKLTTAANTIFLQATSPLYILLLSPWLLREQIRRSDVVFMVIVGLGLAMFFVGVERPVATAPDPFKGNIFAALSGVSCALMLMGLRWMGRREERNAGSGTAAVVAGNTLAFLFCLPWALPLEAHQVTDWAIIVYLGVFQIGVAYILLTAAMRQVPALEASLLLLLEPVMNPLWAWIVHGEEPGAWSLSGGAIILTATVVKTVRDVRGG
jgi:drug/metabolite transporter (DMT)-like permease